MAKSRRKPVCDDCGKALKNEDATMVRSVKFYDDPYNRPYHNFSQNYSMKHKTEFYCLNCKPTDYKKFEVLFLTLKADYEDVGHPICPECGYEGFHDDYCVFAELLNEV